MPRQPEVSLSYRRGNQGSEVLATQMKSGAGIETPRCPLSCGGTSAPPWASPTGSWGQHADAPFVLAGLPFPNSTPKTGPQHHCRGRRIYQRSRCLRAPTVSRTHSLPSAGSPGLEPRARHSQPLQTPDPESSPTCVPSAKARCTPRSRASARAFLGGRPAPHHRARQAGPPGTRLSGSGVLWTRRPLAVPDQVTAADE